MVSATDEALAGRIACVDLETTGGHAVRDRVIEAGIVLLGMARCREFSTLVNRDSIPARSSKFTGITEAMVADAPRSRRSPTSLSRLGPAVRRPQRASTTDSCAASSAACRRFRAPVLCTVRLSRAPTPVSGHNLDAVMHATASLRRAAPRARRRVGRFPASRGRWPADAGPIVEKLRGPRLRRSSTSVADELPEGPGSTFSMRTTHCCTSQAKNLATRVRIAERRARRERVRLVRRIEWIETAGNSARWSRSAAHQVAGCVEPTPRGADGSNHPARAG
jgi:hypothetical protein